MELPELLSKVQSSSRGHQQRYHLFPFPFFFLLTLTSHLTRVRFSGSIEIQRVTNRSEVQLPYPLYTLFGRTFRMWRLFRSLGGYSTPYEDTPEDPTDPATLELDPISCAGRVKVGRLQEEAVKLPCLDFSKKAFSFITDATFYESLRLAPSSKKPLKVTSKKWIPHLLSLVTFGILIAIAYPKLRDTATYFAVEKRNEDRVTARAIFNGREISAGLQPPPPVNLAMISDLLEKISAEKGPMSAITLDFRHWFHQIPLKRKVSCNLAVGRGNTYWRWRTLPMGISWAPFVAQCLGWASLVVNANHLYDIDVNKHLGQPPCFLRLKGGGFVTLYYDNVLAIGNEAVISELKAIWLKNFSTDLFDITLKEIDHLTPSQMSSGVPIKYLGVHIERMKRSSRDRDGFFQSSYYTRWKQIPERLKKWIPHLEKIGSSPTMTYRNLSKICGRVIWAETLKKHTMIDLHPLIRILRRCMQHKHVRKHDWDTSVSLTKEEQATLLYFTKKITANQYQYADETDDAHPRKEVWACSDSSTPGRGFVIFPASQTTEGVSHEWGKTWNADEVNWHIYRKEFHAAMEAITGILELHGKSLHIRLGVDNSAVYHALARKYSNNEDAIKLLLKIRDMLSTSNSILSVTLLRSEENAADPASRNVKLTSAQARICRSAMARQQLRDAIEGIRSNDYDIRRVPAHNSSGGLRHDEMVCPEEDRLTNFLCGEVRE